MDQCCRLAQGHLISPAALPGRSYNPFLPISFPAAAVAEEMAAAGFEVPPHTLTGLRSLGTWGPRLRPLCHPLLPWGGALDAPGRTRGEAEPHVLSPAAGAPGKHPPPSGKHTPLALPAGTHSCCQLPPELLPVPHITLSCPGTPRAPPNSPLSNCFTHKYPSYLQCNLQSPVGTSASPHLRQEFQILQERAHT